MITCFRNITAKIVKSKYMNRWAVLLMDSCVSMCATVLVYLVVAFFSNLKFSEYFLLLVAGMSLVCSLVLFYIFDVYRGILRHTTIYELAVLFLSLLLKTLFLFVFFLAVGKEIGLTVSPVKLFIAHLSDLIFSLFILVSIRITIVYGYNMLLNKVKSKTRNILIYGDDNKAISLATLLSNNQDSEYTVVGFVNCGNKISKLRLLGLPVLMINDPEYFKKVVFKYDVDAVVFPEQKMAIEEKDRLVSFCVRESVNLMLMPSVNEFTPDEKIHVQLRDISIEDLLGRDEINVDMSEISEFLNGKVVMVTGAAGSIGSELCRLISKYDVKQLVMLDNSETPLHDLQLELIDSDTGIYTGTTDRNCFVLADVRNRVRINTIFDCYKPDIIFHAAAYKHVPMMESNPTESINVNVIGTKVIADAALRTGAEKMIMVSTDKAVNPTNVMGASKRIAEIYVQSLSRAVIAGKVGGKTKFVTTRFGNVLGSNGSVIPRFKEQIKNGGPVTVTDKNIIRYFMTIPEACRLVLEAATMGEGYEIFVFDMGKPVRIADLARNMIYLAGFKPDVDIKIVYTGLRQGEKLYEELLNNAEETLPTKNGKIFVAKVREYDYDYVQNMVLQLKDVARQSDVENTLIGMKKLVPEFKSQNSIYQKYDK